MYFRVGVFLVLAALLAGIGFVVAPQRGVDASGEAPAMVTLVGVMVDAVSREALPCRVHIEGPDGSYYPPVGHTELPPERKYNSYISYEPDVINMGHGMEKAMCWAVLDDGSFRVELPAVDGIRLQAVRGLEFERPEFIVDLAGAHGEVRREFPVKRWIDMQAKGWMSGDSHVHNLTPEGAIRQMQTEDLDYVNLMFIGPGHRLLLDGHVTGRPSDVSTEDRFVYVSQEIRDAQQGHLTTLNMKKPIEPIQGYTGQEEKHMEPRPNEPFNWDIWEELHAQGGLTFHAHYVYWPGYASPVCAALGKLDGVEFSQPDMVVRGPQTRLNIEVPGYPLTGAGPLWYHMLSCGVRLPLVGGTDKMSASRVVGGAVRTYAKVEDWSHDGFIEALRRGAAFVTNGPMLELTVNGQGMGSEVALTGAGPFPVQITAECHSDRPIAYLQVLRNGEVIYNRTVGESEKSLRVVFEIHVDKSCWLAVRAGNTSYDDINWERSVTAAHSSPIYVTVNGELPAVRESAKFMIARMDVVKQWCNAMALYSSEDIRRQALEVYETALRFYQDALARAEQ